MASISQIPMVLMKVAIIIVLFPLFVVLICPIYLVRLGVILMSKVLRPDLVQILGVRDTLYGIDDISSAPKSSVICTMVVKGRFRREDAFKKIEFVTSLKLDKNQLKYPELKRYLVKWMGFLFWKDDPNFDLNNHISYYQPNSEINGNQEWPVADEGFVQRAEKALLNEPYQLGKSAWELVIVPNYKPRPSAETPWTEVYTVLLFKLHHSFIDGFSVTRLCTTELCDGDVKDLPQPHFPKYNCVVSSLLCIYLVFKTPYDMLTELLLKADRNSWYLAGTEITNEIKTAISDKIPSQRFKDIAKHFGVSFTSVVVAAVSGGIRKMMLERNELKESSSFSCMCPFPVPGHPDTLGNYLSDCYVDFPIQIEDPVQRLQEVEQNLLKLKYSTVPLSNFAIQPFVGGLFYWLVDPLIRLALSKATGIISSFPGPRTQIHWEDFPVVDAYFTGGHDNPGIGIQFLALNYNGNWKLKVQADSGTLSSEAEVEQLLKYILLELDCYLKFSYV